MNFINFVFEDSRTIKSIIRPVIGYSAEIMTIKLKDKEDFRIVKRLRTRLSPIKIGENEYKSRMNHELEQKLEGMDSGDGKGRGRTRTAWTKDVKEHLNRVKMASEKG